MKPDNILRQNIKLNSTVKEDYPKGHLNGLLFVIDPSKLLRAVDLDANPAQCDSIINAVSSYINKAVLKVKYYDSSTHHMLVPSIPVKHFVDITDIKYGSTGMQLVEEIANDVNVIGLGDTAYIPDQLSEYWYNILQENSKRLPIISFYVDLGSINVDNGDEIDFELLSNLQIASDVGELSVYALSIDEEPFHYVKYDTDNDTNELHNQVVESYLTISDTSKDFDVNISSVNRDYSTDKNGLISVNALFNAHENDILRRLLPVFTGTKELPEDVEIKVTSRDGSKIDYVQVLNKRISSSYQKYLLDKQESRLKLAKVVQKAERDEKSSDFIAVVKSEGALK